MDVPCSLPMNFSESLTYLHQLGNEVLTMNLGLETIRCLCGALGDPQQVFPAIHVAGTNGKGSTVAMTEAILRAAGYRTGLFTSPHLLSVTERICVAGEPIPTGDFARLATVVRQVSERLRHEGRLEAGPTFFELITAIGYLWFAEQRVDLAVLEVGMGGRLDATNICRPIVTAITPVGLDHQQYLGTTVAAIAGEKAGIIKPGVPVVVAPQELAARQVILARAAELAAPVSEGRVITERIEHTDDLRQRITFRSSFGLLTPRLALRGDHQRINAATALSIVELLPALGWSIGVDAILHGLETTCWPGRLDLRGGRSSGPQLLIDGAHNIAGVEALCEFLAEHCVERPLTLIFGIMRDKDVAALTERLFPLFGKIILTRVASPRALDPAEIMPALEFDRVPSLSEALELARRGTPPDGLIVVAGSLHLAGEVLASLGE
jgi:dihydrofolate synthase/folylpolyglutamate synthase